MTSPRRVRATIKRIIEIRYDVFTEQYDGSYSEAQILASEAQTPLSDFFRNVEYDLISDNAAMAVTDITQHADYPHEPGTLYDCTACEAKCHCKPGESECVHCSYEHYGRKAGKIYCCEWFDGPATGTETSCPVCGSVFTNVAQAS